jgi:hypothetical protein
MAYRRLSTSQVANQLHGWLIWCGRSLAMVRGRATEVPAGRVTLAIGAAKPQATWGANHHVVVSQQQAADPRPQIRPRLIRHVMNG